MRISQEALQRIVEGRSYAYRLGLVLFGLGIVTSIAAPWLPGVPVAAVFGLLAMQCFLAFNLLGQIERLQAALYMKQATLGWGDESDLR